MSTILLPIYRTEAGVHSNPATSALYNTSCDGTVKKRFVEVFIHWVAMSSTWVEDPVFVSGQSIVALRVDNECEDTFAYINYPASDFRLAQLCCFTDAEPEEGVFSEEFGEEFI